MTRKRGSGAVEYIAVLLLISAVSAAVLTAGVPGRVAAACEAAVCRVAGGNCPARQQDPQAGGRPDNGGHAQPGSTEPTAPTVPTASPSSRTGALPPRPPIPKPVCTPEPAGEWTDRLSAHNDYQNQNPLMDSLDHGGTSVEADVRLDDKGEFQLEHDSDDTSAGTLREKYVEPLIERTRKNGGQVYRGRNEPFQLFVEVKSADGNVYRKLLQDVRGLPPGVQIFIDAGTPGAELGRQPPNVRFYDTLGDDCELPPAVDPESPRYNRAYAENIVMLNGTFSSCADRNGDNRISDAEQRKFNAIVQKAHDAGQQVRIWGAPDGRIRVPGDHGGFFPCPGFMLPGRQSCEGEAQRDAWRAELEAGVDYVLTNHLTQGRKFVRSCGREH